MATKRTLQYLVGTTNLEINYKSNDASLTSYSDADFVNNELDYRSLLLVISSRLVMWPSLGILESNLWLHF